MKIWIGVDIGSVSANFVVINEIGEILYKNYRRTAGKPLDAITEGMKCLSENFKTHRIMGIGATGSGRKLVDMVVGCDVVKNEITAHMHSAKFLHPSVGTIIEIGGQDSKIIQIDEKGSFNFAMNTVCAAGTGAFLDRIADRIGMSIKELGKISTKDANALNIAGRCAVFAETDMIHKQQRGHSIRDIYSGLCRALVRNYLSNLTSGEKLKGPILFQGGVAGNKGIVEAFEMETGEELIIPKYFDVMGAFGVALISKCATREKSNFKGFEALNNRIDVKSFLCEGCSNSCELSKISLSQHQNVVTGGKCDFCQTYC